MRMFELTFNLEVTVKSSNYTNTVHNLLNFSSTLLECDLVSVNFLKKEHCIPFYLSIMRTAHLWCAWQEIDLSDGVLSLPR